MLEHRLDALLNGDPPSLKDFGDFVGLAERMPSELLWTVLHELIHAIGHAGHDPFAGEQ